MLIVDTNAHLYSEDELKYPPIRDARRPPLETGYLNTLKMLMAQNHVSAVCAVQTYSFYQWDSRYVCDLSQNHDGRIAGICMVDPVDPASPLLLERYVRQSGIRGLRCYPSSDGRLDHEGVRALWAKSAELGIVLTASVTVEKADELANLMSDFPTLPVVLDHCMITTPVRKLEPILASILGLARLPNAYAKLSFLPLGSQEPYPYRDMHEACIAIIAAFGPDRCVWGNSFPCELWSRRSTYAQNLRLFTEELGLDDAVKATILGQTANRLWFNGSLPTHSLADCAEYNDESSSYRRRRVYRIVRHSGTHPKWA